MLKRIMMVLAFCLFTAMGVSAQDIQADCSPAKIATALNGAYQRALADLDSGVSPQTVLANLQTKLAAIQAACPGETTALPESTTFATGLEDYADIPQSRLEDGGFVLGGCKHHRCIQLHQFEGQFQRFRQTAKETFGISRRR